MIHHGVPKVLDSNNANNILVILLGVPYSHTSICTINRFSVVATFTLARVTPTLPKQERPVREGARVASVETGLAAAAAKLAQQVSMKQPIRHRIYKEVLSADLSYFDIRSNRRLHLRENTQKRR